MRVSSLPVHAKRIYHSPRVQWNAKFKKLSDSELLSLVHSLVQSLIEQAQKNAYDQLHFATLALSELSIRRYGVDNSEQLNALAKKIQTLSDACIVHLYYGVELAGIKNKCISSTSDSEELARPYFRDVRMKDIFLRWKRGNANSFEEYVCTTLSDRDKKRLKKLIIRYLEPREQKEYLATFDKGQLYIGDTCPGNGLYIFALDREGKKLLIGRKSKGKFQHTSFFAGEPVQCAGVLEIKEGKIVRVDLKSGHYLPTEMHGEYLRQFLSHPDRLGAEAASHLPILAFHKLTKN